MNRYSDELVVVDTTLMLCKCCRCGGAMNRWCNESVEWRCYALMLGSDEREVVVQYCEIMRLLLVGEEQVKRMSENGQKVNNEHD